MQIQNPCCVLNSSSKLHFSTSLFTIFCLRLSYITVHSTRISHFLQNSEENFTRREFSSISIVRFPRSFLNFSSTDILQTVRR